MFATLTDKGVKEVEEEEEGEEGEGGKTGLRGRMLTGMGLLQEEKWKEGVL